MSAFLLSSTQPDTDHTVLPPGLLSLLDHLTSPEADLRSGAVDAFLGLSRTHQRALLSLLCEWSSGVLWPVGPPHSPHEVFPPEEADAVLQQALRAMDAGVLAEDAGALASYALSVLRAQGWPSTAQTWTALLSRARGLLRERRHE